MKTTFLSLLILSFGIMAKAQNKITTEQARLICAQEMAAFTKCVSFAYQKGNSYEQFQFALCGKSQLSPEGNNQLRAAYNFLLQAVSNDAIIKTYPGKEIAASLGYLNNLHKNGKDSDGSELFGGRTGTDNASFAKNSGGCKWYQFWCLMQTVATWLVMNWPGVQELIDILNGPTVVF